VDCFNGKIKAFKQNLNFQTAFSIGGKKKRRRIKKKKNRPAFSIGKKRGKIK